jgi:hypothetical protein
MGWWSSLLVGVLTSVAGCLGAGLVAGLLVQWLRISSREGESGFFIVGVALLGLFGGLVVGVVCARLVAAGANPGFLKAVAVAFGATAGILALVTGLSWLQADFPPTLDGRRLVVEVEVRLPPGVDIPSGGTVSPYEWHVTITADHGKRRQSMGLLRPEEASRADGAWVVPATVPLSTSDYGKALGVKLGDRGSQYFRMSLPGRPTRADLEWGPWLTGPTDGNLQPVPPGDAASVRYRVQPWVEPPPEPPAPTREEIEAAEESEKAEAFSGLTESSPVEAWLRFTHYGEPQERREAAAAAIARRPDVVAELSALILSGDRETSDLALRSVALMDTPPPGLAPSVEQVGRQIADEIRVVNATPADADPSYEHAAAASVRFAGWNEAARTLHGRAGIDLRPVMRELLELSRVRAESMTMQDVARVAGFYVDAWGEG